MTNIRNGLTIFPYNMLEKTCAGFLSSLSGWGTNFENIQLLDMSSMLVRQVSNLNWVYPSKLLQIHGIISTYKFWMCTSLYVYTSGVEPYAYLSNSLKF